MAQPYLDEDGAPAVAPGAGVLAEGAARTTSALRVCGRAAAPLAAGAPGYCGGACNCKTDYDLEVWIMIMEQNDSVLK